MPSLARYENTEALAVFSKLGPRYLLMYSADSLIVECGPAPKALLADSSSVTMSINLRESRRRLRFVVRSKPARPCRP
jgi:hypothetical protein